MILQTDRLILREMVDSDFADLCKILQDEVAMYAYEHAFSDEEVRSWLDRQKQRYIDDGFGLWAVILKETGEFIGQCGITMQSVELDVVEQRVHEVGYLFCRSHWHKGYATEAAIACRNYAFDTLKVDKVYSIIRDNNLSSIAVAKRNGMQAVGGFTKHYYNVDMPHIVYCINK